MFTFKTKDLQYAQTTEAVERGSKTGAVHREASVGLPDWQPCQVLQGAAHRFGWQGAKGEGQDLRAAQVPRRERTAAGVFRMDAPALSSHGLRPRGAEGAQGSRLQQNSQPTQADLEEERFQNVKGRFIE